MKASDRLSQVEALLGPELTAKHREAVEFGVRARLSPEDISEAVLRREAELVSDGPDWCIEHDWGVSFVYQGRRLGDRFCEPTVEKLATSLRDLARAATEAADSLQSKASLEQEVTPAPLLKGDLDVAASAIEVAAAALAARAGKHRRRGR